MAPYFQRTRRLSCSLAQKTRCLCFEIEHRKGTSNGHADCMPRLSATTAALNMTAALDVDASVVGQPNPSSQNLPSFSSHTPPAQPSQSTNIPRDTINSNQTDDEQFGITNGHEAGANKPVLQFSVNDEQGDLLIFPHAKADRISADIKLAAGFAKPVKEKTPKFFPNKKEY